MFWAHHANIDRLYECWLRSANGRLPTDPAILNAAYWFVDENGTMVQRTVRDMLTTAQLSYRYTQGRRLRSPGADDHDDDCRYGGSATDHHGSGTG